MLVIARKMSARARAKGYPGYTAAIGVVAWVLGEFLGACCGAHLGLELGVMATSLAGAALGALAAFAIVARLPDRSASLRLDELEETFR